MFEVVFEDEYLAALLFYFVGEHVEECVEVVVVPLFELLLLDGQFGEEHFDLVVVHPSDVRAQLEQRVQALVYLQGHVLA